MNIITNENNSLNKLDVFIGRRLKQRRTFVGMSQEELGNKVGVTFQQIQKYEKGSNRIGASRLFDVANALSVKINYFFEDFNNGFAKSNNQKLGGNFNESQTNNLKDNNSSKELASLIKVFSSIEDSKVRKKVLSLVKSLSNIAN